MSMANALVKGSSNERNECPRRRFIRWGGGGGGGSGGGGGGGGGSSSFNLTIQASADGVTKNIGTIKVTVP